MATSDDQQKLFIGAKHVADVFDAWLNEPHFVEFEVDASSLPDIYEASKTGSTFEIRDGDNVLADSAGRKFEYASPARGSSQFKGDGLTRCRLAFHGT